MGARFRKCDRVIRQEDFRRLRESPLFAADHVLVMKAAANGLDRTRLGLAVSVHTGISVQRNRWKRIIREQFRLNRDRLPTGWDLLVRPRRGAAPDSRLVGKSLVALMQRIDGYARRQAKRSGPPPETASPAATAGAKRNRSRDQVGGRKTGTRTSPRKPPGGEDV